MSARQICSGLIDPFGQNREGVEYLRHSLLVLVAILANHPTRGTQVFPDAHRAKYACPSGNLSYSKLGDLVWRGVGDVPAIKDHSPEVGFGHTRDCSQQGGLAGTIRAEQGNDLTLIDFNVDVEQDLQLRI